MKTATSTERYLQSNTSRQPLLDDAVTRNSRTGKTEKQREGTPPAGAIASLPSKGDSGRKSATSGWGKEDYFGVIRNKIVAAKHYPPEALNEGSSGTTVVGFALHRNGSVSDVRVIKSSLSGILDTAATRTVHKAAPFPPVPAKIKGDLLDIQVPISFEIVKY